MQIFKMIKQAYCSCLVLELSLLIFSGLSIFLVSLCVPMHEHVTLSFQEVFQLQRQAGRLIAESKLRLVTDHGDDRSAIMNAALRYVSSIMAK